MTKYIDTADQAKMIRKDLKVAFPATKFSVKISRYSGGSSVSISWADGPTTKDVETVVSYYEGKGAIDNTDYCPSLYRIIDGEEVHFMGSIMCQRTFSVDFFRRQMERVAKENGVEAVEVIESHGSAYAPKAWTVKLGHYSDLQTETYRKAEQTRASDCKLGQMPKRAQVQSVRAV